MASALGDRNHLAGAPLQRVNLAEYVKPRITAAVEILLKESAKNDFAFFKVASGE